MRQGRKKLGENLPTPEANGIVIPQRTIRSLIDLFQLYGFRIGEDGKRWRKYDV